MILKTEEEKKLEEGVNTINKKISNYSKKGLTDSKDVKPQSDNSTFRKTSLASRLLARELSE